MPNNWKTYKLEELTTKLGDGLHGTPKYSEFGEYYFINGNNLTNGKIEIKKDTKKVTYEEFLKHKKDLNENTLFVSINGTIGNVGIYNGEKVILGKSACYFNIKEGVDKEFIKQIFSSKLSRDYLENNATGTTIKNVSLKTMREFPINLPPLEEQKSIAAILSAIDDKIENNLAINKTLEEMAMALYKHWFVDFGPFQDGEFVETELGRIPKGWEVKRLDEIVDVGSSKRIFYSEYVEEGIPFYRGKEVIELSKGKSISSELFISNEKFEEIKSKFEVPKKGDVLISSVGTIGVSWLVDGFEDFYFKDGNLTWLKNYKTFLKGEYLHLWLNSENGKNQINGEVIGSTQKALTISSLRNFKILFPSENVYKIIGEEFVNYYEQRQLNLIEIKTLTQLRDTLLPKLISGEVRLKEFRESITN
ncbi:restriction endonuclease subunit S [Flavobacterium flavipallidum]|uniref:Restriction endonuclease subunit S n=1 Tax=Flavobacterium flavipallidum TaxID=3139140 RepID=A0ABU9HQY2_9FLAO